MSDKMEIYYFSPTGGTKKVSDIFAAAVGKDVVWHDLRDKQTPTKQPQGELIIVAAPVFAGRIPSVVREKIKTLAGEGKCSDPKKLDFYYAAEFRICCVFFMQQN